MQHLLLICGLVVLVVSQDDSIDNDPPIVAAVNSLDNYHNELDNATKFCYTNNVQGNYNAKDMLKGTAFGAKMESGKTFIHCLMREMKWIQEKSSMFMRGKILSDVQNGMRPSSGTMSAKMPLELLVRQCLRGVTKEVDDYSLSYATARCLFNAGLQLKPETLRIMKLPPRRM